MLTFLFCRVSKKKSAIVLSKQSIEITSSNIELKTGSEIKTYLMFFLAGSAARGRDTYRFIGSQESSTSFQLKKVSGVKAPMRCR